MLASWSSCCAGSRRAIGGVAPELTLFFFGLLFVFFMLLHFSVRVSALERRLTALVQEVGLLGVDAGGRRDGAAPRSRPSPGAAP